MQATTLDPAERQTRSARRHRAAATAFIAVYVVGWAWLVGLTDPSRWDALLAGGFAVLFALVLVHEIVATARSLRTGGTQAPPLDGAEPAPAERAPHD
jgi:biotin transporter BioY